MRLPRKGSRAEGIIHRRYNGAATIEQDIAAHGRGGLSLAEIGQMHHELVITGCLVVADGVYSLSVRLRDYLDGALMIKPTTVKPLVTAGPTYRPEPRPLRTSATARLRESRPGAFDYQNVPSRIGDASVPYQSSLVVDRK